MINPAKINLRSMFLEYIPQVSVDDARFDGAIFIIRDYDTTIRYDYENNKAWRGDCFIKSKRKLMRYRDLCKKHIENCAGE